MKKLIAVAVLNVAMLSVFIACDTPGGDPDFRISHRIESVCDDMLKFAEEAFNGHGYTTSVYGKVEIERTDGKKQSYDYTGADMDRVRTLNRSIGNFCNASVKKSQGVVTIQALTGIRSYDFNFE